MSVSCLSYLSFFLSLCPDLDITKGSVSCLKSTQTTIYTGRDFLKSSFMFYDLCTHTFSPHLPPPAVHLGQFLSVSVPGVIVMHMGP